jgi:hypothetical protein
MHMGRHSVGLLLFSPGLASYMSGARSAPCSWVPVVTHFGACLRSGWARAACARACFCRQLITVLRDSQVREGVRARRRPRGARGQRGRRSLGLWNDEMRVIVPCVAATWLPILREGHFQCVLGDGGRAG